LTRSALGFCPYTRAIIRLIGHIDPLRDDPFQPNLAGSLVHGVAIALVVIDGDDALSITSLQLLDQLFQAVLRVNSG
jgi:hypothetical protein